MDEGCPEGCVGHRRFVGGFMDGHIDHMASITGPDFPIAFRYQNGSVYARRPEAGPDAVYVLVDHADTGH